MPYLTNEQIDEKARQFRRTLGIDDQTQPDVMTVITKLKHLGMLKNYERVPDAEMPDDEAEYNPEKGLLRVRESVFCAANNLISSPRARWTIAHEIGHLALGHTKLRHRNVSGRTIEKIAPSIKQDEYQAHRFAAAFLAPSHLVPRPLETSAAQIAELFNISLTAAERRKRELEEVYRRSRGILRALPSSIADLLRDAEKKGHKVTSLKVDDQRRRQDAKANGYEEQACGQCTNFTLVRSGAYMKCDSCGSTTRCS